MSSSPTDARAAAVAAALAPYPWRGLTARMLARRVIGAADRYAVIEFVSGLPGTDVGAPEPVGPADPDDERVDALVRVLESRHWRGWSLARLCSDLMSALEVWQAERLTFHADVRRLLDDH